VVRLIKIVPCACAALAVHVLGYAVWFALQGPVEHPPEYDEPVSVRLLPSRSDEELTDDLDEHTAHEREADALREELRHALEQSRTTEPWEGSFGYGDGFTGVSLLLTQDGFVKTHWYCTGEFSGWGSVEAGTDSITLRPSSPAEPSERLFVMPWRGWTYLVPAPEMRDFLYQALSGVLEFPFRGPTYLRRPRTSAPDQDRAPDGYRALWDSLPHLVVRRVTAASGATPRLVEFELTADESLQVPQLRLYWDADPSGGVHAIERERDGSRLVAYLDSSDGESAGCVQPGATFTALARLR
jgi:hypothetical protein